MFYICLFISNVSRKINRIICRSPSIIAPVVVVVVVSIELASRDTTQHVRIDIE